jgi:RNA polymerase sigma-B factor
MDPHAAVLDLPGSRSERITATDHLLRIAHDERHAEDVRHDALNAAITINLHVAASIAGQHRGRGIPLEDLEQVAYAALVRTASAFDPERGRDFLAYAVPSIRGEVKRWFRDHGWTVRPPRSVQENQSRVVAARDRLEAELGHPARAAEIAAEVDLSEDAVRDALAAQGCFHPVSLDAPSGPDGAGTFGERLADEPDVEESALRRVVVSSALDRLQHRDREIVRLRWYEQRTQQEIADAVGTTQVQVSRRLARILRELRDILRVDRPEQDLPPAA